MKKRVAYIEECDIYSMVDVEIELTGFVKRIIVNEKTHLYFQTQRRLFGIPIYKAWVKASDVRFDVIEYGDKDSSEFTYFDAEIKTGEID